MTDLKDIPADTTIKMTEDLIRAFKIADCDPTCHNCGEELVAGMLFKLAHVKELEFYSTWTLEHSIDQAESTDEMLCDNCTADDLYQSRIVGFKIEFDSYQDRINHRGAFRGYTRKHKFND